MRTGFHYDGFTADSSPEMNGYELTVPIAIAQQWEYLTIGLDTAYSDVEVDLGNGIDSSIAGLTDMLWSLSYTYAIPGHQTGLIFGFDLNIPTGKAGLTERQIITYIGESNDLFTVDNFGEGFNMGVSGGIMHQFEKAVLAFQGAYIYNGAFDPTLEIEADDIDPGNQTLVISFVEWHSTPWLTLGTAFSYTHFSPDKTAGEEYFRQGEQVSVGVDLRFTRNSLGGFMSLQRSFSEKNELLNQTADRLETESDNSNGQDYYGSAVVSYDFSDTFRARLGGNVRYYGESALKDAQIGLPYSGKRLRYAVETGINYSLNSNISCNGILRFFIMDQDRDIFFEEDVTYRGLDVGLGWTYMF
ncbi:MAG: hypothetical protein GY801_41625 [bacterium]|nr:hypothetical protein [bacterium]